MSESLLVSKFVVITTFKWKYSCLDTVGVFLRAKSWVVLTGCGGCDSGTLLLSSPKGHEHLAVLMW